MELYYNPDQMPDSEIKQTFVARQWLIDELLSLLKRQPSGAGTQHAVIIGPRGIGKTTVLLMFRLGIVGSELGKRWFPVRFPEESYSVNDLADFWMATLSHLAYESGDASLAATADALRKESGDAGALCDATVAALKDWCRKRKQRLVLLVDNLDMIFDQIGDSTENARLRDVLMNDGIFMLVGTATSFFKEARQYDQPLFNFFRTYNLDSLNSPQIDDLLRQRAAVDKRANFDELLKQNEARIKVLHYFTGGNPRLVLMLYRIVASSDFGDVRRALEKLLDEVTPYYKAKIESLPAQQRKILDHVARVSGRTQEGLTPTEIARDTRLAVNLVSSQLKRLSDLGYVRAANLRSRNSFYSLAEPLYAIWHQMRFGRESRKRMGWLVDFLRGWYTNREIAEQTQQLASRFAELLEVARDSALENLEFRRYLSAAMELDLRAPAIDRLLCDSLNANELDKVRETVSDIDLTYLQWTTVKRLEDSGVITKDQIHSTLGRLEEIQQEAERAVGLLNAQDYLGALKLLDGMKQIYHWYPRLWLWRASALAGLSRYSEALEDYDKGLPMVQDNDAACIRAWVLHKLKDYDAAIESSDRVLDGTQSDARAQVVRGMSLLGVGRFDEALSSLRNAASATGEIGQKAQTLIDAFQALDTPLEQFNFLVSIGSFDSARVTWRRLVGGGITEHNSSALAAIPELLQPGNIAFFRDLIRESNLDEIMLPITRALDYIATGDRNLIERLSAEVRPIAEEIVSEYMKRQSPKADKTPATKKRPARRRKQLQP
jgi:tetratricopeptide (TPR) repeat protein